MKNIKSRISKLEQKILPDDRFLVVISKKGESYQSALQRVLEENKITKSPSEFFIIYLNLHGPR